MRRSVETSAKYAVDRLIAAAALLMLAPALACTAAAIKVEDGGPVLYRQTRIGRYGVPFTIWKYRTMRVDADKYLGDDGTVRQEGRITRVGMILRSTSLDELPQLFNILRGEMSFIGPRPAVMDDYVRYNSAQRRRCAMKPGITGLAQITGRNTLPKSKRIELDLAYIDHYSLWLDLQIAVRTVPVWLLRRGVVMDRNPEDVDDLGS